MLLWHNGHYLRFAHEALFCSSIMLISLKNGIPSVAMATRASLQLREKACVDVLRQPWSSKYDLEIDRYLTGVSLFVHVTYPWFWCSRAGVGSPLSSATMPCFVWATTASEEVASESSSRRWLSGATLHHGGEGDESIVPEVSRSRAARWSASEAAWSSSNWSVVLVKEQGAGGEETFLQSAERERRGRFEGLRGGGALTPLLGDQLSHMCI